MTVSRGIGKDHRLLNLTGKRFGRWLVVKRHSQKIVKNSNYRTYWLCRCVCGVEKIIRADILKTDKQKICNKHRDNNKHKLTKSPEYNVWHGMQQRCYNKNDKNYINYGGRGINISKYWRYSFLTFYNDIGKRPSNKHSIDRINVNGNYCKENCRWATSKEQNNNKRNSVPPYWVEKVIELRKEGFLYKEIKEKLEIQDTLPNIISWVKKINNGHTVARENRPWGKEALFLRNKGLSIAKIGKQLKLPKSTVQAFLFKQNLKSISSEAA